MKKYLFVMLCLCPFTLLSNETVSSQPQETTQKSLQAHISTKRITRMINHLWRLVAKGRFHTVYHMMTRDYTMLRPDGSVFNRKQAIQFFKDLKIVEVKDISKLFVVIGKETISAYYIRPERLAGSTEFVDYPLITIFQKVEGTWKWKAEPRSSSLPF